MSRPLLQRGGRPKGSKIKSKNDQGFIYRWPVVACGGGHNKGSKNLDGREGVGFGLCRSRGGDGSKIGCSN